MASHELPILLSDERLPKGKKGRGSLEASPRSRSASSDRTQSEQRERRSDPSERVPPSVAHEFLTEELINLRARLCEFEAQLTATHERAGRAEQRLEHAQERVRLLEHENKALGNFLASVGSQRDPDQRYGPGGRKSEVQPPRLPKPPPQVRDDIEDYDERPDPLAASNAIEFLDTLRAYRLWAGQPSFREMQANCGKKVSYARFSSALSSDELPPLRLVEAFIEGCRGGEKDIQRWTTAWRRLAMRKGEEKPVDRHGGCPPP